MSNNYYKAYNERYKTVHKKGFSWSSSKNTPIVLETINRFDIRHNMNLLEIGCGEARDSKKILENGYDLLAIDVSDEAIEYCKKNNPKYINNFSVLDCLSDKIDKRFDFIFSIAVIHMLVLDEDRNGFYRFIYDHLKENGVALVCSMGDGKFEMQSDINKAFDIQEREHESGKMMVASTSCKMVSFPTFEEEINRNQLEIIEKGITSSLPDFNCLMYAIVQKKTKITKNVHKKTSLRMESLYIN